MKRVFVFLLATLSLLAAGRTYTVSALVLKTDLASHSMTVSEEAIPGFMDAMVMSYRVPDPQLLNPLHPGDKVQFTLTVGSDTSTVSGIKVVPYQSFDREPLQAQVLAFVETTLDGDHKAVEIHPGQMVPDFTLTDQTDKTVTLSQFRGKVVAMTFVYTRCPLPDYCLRLSNNFGRVQHRFASRMGSDLVLLSVSFDPTHDTPDVLARYGKIWNANPAGWHLLTGPPDIIKKVCNQFGSNFWPEEGVVTHSLHTVVIDRSGKLVANIEGNQFSSEQLGDLIQTYF